MGVEICRGRVSEQRDRREEALHLEKRERCWFQDNASTQLGKGDRSFGGFGKAVTVGCDRALSRKRGY